MVLVALSSLELSLVVSPHSSGDGLHSDPALGAQLCDLGRYHVSPPVESFLSKLRWQEKERWSWPRGLRMAQAGGGERPLSALDLVAPAGSLYGG